MADTEYSVIVKYNAETQAAQQSIGGLAITLDHVLNLMGRAKDMLGTMFHLNSVIENARVAMAGLMQAGGAPGAVNNFNTALQMSSSLINKMMVDAAKIPGTFEDLQMVTQLSMVQGLGAGKSVDEIEQMAQRVFTAGKMLDPHLNGQMVGQEFAMMLEGRARMSSAMFASMKGLMDAGMTAEKFNALSQPERWAQVDKAIKGMDPAIKEFGKTGTAAITTFQMNWENFVRYVTGGLYEALKVDLTEINDWFHSHEGEAKEFAHKIGGSLVEAFREIRKVFEFIVDHRDVILKIAEAMLVAKGYHMLTGGALGSATATAGFNAGGLIGGAAFGYALDRLNGQTSDLSHAFAALGFGLSTLPGTIGLVAKGLTIFYELLQGAANKIDEWQKHNIEVRGDLGDPVSIYKRYEAGGSKLTQTVAQDMAGYLTAHQMLNSFGGVDNSKLTSMLMLSVKMGAFDESGARAFRNLAMLTNDFLLRNKGKGPLVDDGTNGVLFNPDDPMKQAVAKAGKPVSIHNTTVGQVNVYNSIYDAEDPARVIQKLTAKAVRQNIEHAAQSPSVPVYG